MELPADSPGRALSLRVHRFGQRGARPKVYLQAGLHADEMPGPLILHHLAGLLAGAKVTGEIVLVPLANPMGFAQWVNHKPQGRNDLATGRNFNRGFPDLTGLEPADLSPQGLHRAIEQALQAWPTPDENAALRQRLLLLAHDADHILDLHCDHFAVPHLYASPARPEVTDLLSACMGAQVALVAEISGGHAFDEALTAAHAALRRRFPGPPGPFAATLEYRGQFDVSDALAAQDASNLMTFLAAVGVLRGASTPAHPPAPQLPLTATQEAFAPQGGIVTWEAAPGDHVQQGQTIAQVTDPTTGLRLPVPAPCDGLLFRQELWRHCLRGQSLAHVAGHEPAREGDLLSD